MEKPFVSILIALLVSNTCFAKDFAPNYESVIPADAKEFNMHFKTGQVQINYDATAKQSSLKCEMSPELKPKDFNFTGDYKKFKCVATLASTMNVTVIGASGQVQASQIIADTDIELTDGQIQFTGAQGQAYTFDASVEHGMSPMLPMGNSNISGKKVSVKLRLTNGMISVQ